MNVSSPDTLEASSAQADSAAENRQRLALQQDVWHELRSRVLEVYGAQHHTTEDEVHLQERMHYISTQAQLFFGYPIKSWPPQQLLRKLLRKLLVPILMPQAHYNEAMRDVVLQIQLRTQNQSNTLQGFEDVVDEMRQEVLDLRRQVAMLEEQVKSGSVQNVVSDKGAFPVALLSDGANQ